MKCRSLIIVAALVATFAGPASAQVETHASPNAEQPALWVYAPVNFQVDKRVDDLIALMQRATDAGYSAMVTTDYKWGNFEGRPANYYANLKRTKAAADRIGIEIIPAVCSIGYSNRLLMNDPNLAAALPVRDCDMVVRNGRATIAHTDNLLPFGDGEKWQGDKPTGWSWVDGPGSSVLRDTQTKHAGSSSIRMTNFRAPGSNEHGNCRLNRKLTLKPFHQYHLSAWVKTQNAEPAASIRFAVLAVPGGTSLNYTDLKIKPTQDWQKHEIVFNTLDHGEVNLYFGIWGGKGGTIWVDDIALREVAGVNLLRREGCPIRVTSADGRTVYEEGRDFARWEYAKMGRVPWAGSYQVMHDEPPITLTPGSRIGEGDPLKVSYYHTTIIYGDQVCCSLLHDDVFKYVEREVAKVNEYFQPRTWLMSHDEIRVAGWDDLYAEGQTVGEALASNVARCASIIRKASPGAQVYVWSDMFDPHHNARDDYYLCRTTLAGSWKGLDKQIGIANWNFGKRDKSLTFFAERGHRQMIAGYYDASDVEARIAKWRQVCRGTEGITAVMYTTWRGNYSDLERFAKAVRAEGWR